MRKMETLCFKILVSKAICSFANFLQNQRVWEFYHQAICISERYTLSMLATSYGGYFLIVKIRLDFLKNKSSLLLYLEALNEQRK